MPLKQQRTVWIICMAMLILFLYGIVASRIQSRTDVILGGADGAYVRSDSVSFTDPSLFATPEPTEDNWPKIDITMNQYTMVNADHPISSSFRPDVMQISDSYMVFDSSALPHLEDMIQGLKDAGFSVYVAGAYRSYSFQEQLFNGKASQIALGLNPPVDDYMDPRYQEAVEKAKKITMFPGTSEHQLGLAVDLMDRNYTPQIYENMNQEFFAWLDAHCAEYGFIKRYPTRKLLLTGWDEPWHYRYVGVEAATFIMENGICYEEFYAHYDPEFTY